MVVNFGGHRRPLQEQTTFVKNSRTTAGFTMVEIAICLAIIGFALVAIIGVLPIGMNVQKDNREETVINFDANYLINAIRNGAQAQNELTNYILNVTNIATPYSIDPTTANYVPDFTKTVTNYYLNTNNGLFGAVSVNNSTTSLTLNALTNANIIIALLTTPKYVDTGGGTFISNYTTADFRALTGTPVDQGISQGSKDFAFSYRVFPEVIPAQGTPFPIINSNAVAGVLFTRNLQNNLHEIRLRFRWPLLPNGQTANGTQVYRTLASGAITAQTNYWWNSYSIAKNAYFFQSQGYANTLPAGPIPIP